MTTTTSKPDCEWRPEPAVYPQADGTYTVISQCGKHQGLAGQPFHRQLADGLPWDELKRLRVIPQEVSEREYRRP